MVSLQTSLLPIIHEPSDEVKKLTKRKVAPLPSSNDGNFTEYDPSENESSEEEETASDSENKLSTVSDFKGANYKHYIVLEPTALEDYIRKRYKEKSASVFAYLNTCKVARLFSWDGWGQFVCRLTKQGVPCRACFQLGNFFPYREAYSSSNSYVFKPLLLHAETHGYAKDKLKGQVIFTNEGNDFALMGPLVCYF